MSFDADSLPTWRLWGEEKTDGAIYTVYLKKVRYHRPTKSLSSVSDSDDEISHLEWETVRVRFMKAGTLPKLVEALATDNGELETTYINIFLSTYRSFSTCQVVLDLLVERYRQLVRNSRDYSGHQLENAEQHRKTLISALHVWLDTYPEDFRNPPEHPDLVKLLEFCEEHLVGTELEAKIRHRLARYERELAEDEGLLSDAAIICESAQILALRGGALGGGGGVGGCGWRTYQMPEVPVRRFAEQLTRMDSEVFRKLVPHQCLGSVWSRRDKSRSHGAATVLATINQFNAVSLRVISSVLVERDFRASERAQLLACWIDIAQELRILKNFSSLKAIISGLQSNPIYRLQKTWQALSKEKVELFDELARIFSEDNNQWTQRELLMREGTAKFADTVGENDKQLQKLFQRQATNISFGTIPYLGTFLTDLTMIDTAIPDVVGDNLINFDKKRKEFEVLAQIKLLQGAANAYSLQEDPAFDRWFNSILVLDDREAYQLSCQIEPHTSTPAASGKPKVKRSPVNSSGHKKTDSIASSTSSNSSQFYFEADSVPSSPDNSLERNLSSSSSSSLDVSLNSSHSSNNNSRLTMMASSHHRPSQNNSSTSPPDFYIIKVTYENNGPETEGVVLYKSIMLSNNERTPQVIRNAMMKLGLEGNPNTYTLAQVLPNKELVLPTNANVYYAVNTSFDLNFILRKIKDRSSKM